MSPPQYCTLPSLLVQESLPHPVLPLQRWVVVSQTWFVPQVVGQSSEPPQPLPILPQ